MSTDLQADKAELLGDINKYDFRNDERYVFKARKGLDPQIVSEISERKGEPAWMRDFRLKSLEVFNSKPVPAWGGNIDVDFQQIYYYIKPTDHQGRTWDDVPDEIKTTFDRLGIPEAEKKYLAGVKAQYESEVVYGSLREELSKQGVIFTDMDTALREYPDLVREYFSTIIPPTDNKFAALNSAVWSGGSFIYVPPGVKVEYPLQAYFRINAANMGQFERTLIIIDEGGYAHYVEGCTAPMYSSDSLHSAVVKVVAKRGARVRYTTIQNWANNIYNLVTKRAVAYRNALVEWVDGNLGSRLTMKYPSVYMLEPGARARSSPWPSPRPGSTRTPALRSSTAPRTPPAASSRNRSLVLAAELELSGFGESPARRQEVQIECRVQRLDPRFQEPQRHLPVHRTRRAGRDRRPRSERLANR